MWIFTKDGFYSVVQKPNQKGTEMLTVRARDRKDLVNLCDRLRFPKSLIKDGCGTDYEYRMEVKKEEFARYLSTSVRKIDYDNFKHTVKEKDIARSWVYMDVWTALSKLANRIRRPEPRGGLFDDGGIWRGN